MIVQPIKWSLLAATFFVASFSTSFAENIETAARQAYVVDFNTGTILLEKNADEIMTPSSMSKLMTIYTAFSHLKDGSLKMTDEMVVSEDAWRKHYKSGGSLMFLKLNSRVSVSDLLRGIIIQSGNDACTVLAEGLAGSEEAYAEEENRRAKQIGLTNSTFKNASGWPEPGHVSTARDLGILAGRLIRDFPEYYPIFAERKFVYNNIPQDNRNPLLWLNVPGGDGLKTGHTADGGYGLVGSAMRGDRRVILVVNGLVSNKARADETVKLIEWAFRDFNNYVLFKTNEVVTDAEVSMGTAATVPLTTDRNIEVTLRRTARPDMKVAVNYNGPIAAPIRKGDRIATLVVSAPGMPVQEFPLMAGAGVDELGFFGRIGAALGHLLWGA